MRIIETISDLEAIRKGCVLSIGNFDGVHIGHQQILTAAGGIAVERAVELAVMTFEPHPAAILHPEKAPGVLTALSLKEHLLAKYGVDCLIVLKDSAELMGLSPQKFVDEFLVGTVQPDVVVEGENFNFGCGRTGNVHTLRNLGDEKGFKVIVIETAEVKLSIGQALKVSSTLIRNLLQAGKVTDAAVALTRPYRLIGKVIKGRGKGTELGFPTANMAKLNQLIPAEGVYTGLVEIGDSENKVCETAEKIPAALSIGRTETYGAEQPLLFEAHLLQQNVGQLIGKWMAADFIEKIRDQQKFETESQLSAQIAKDCRKAKKILEICD